MKLAGQNDKVTIAANEREYNSNVDAESEQISDQRSELDSIYDDLKTEVIALLQEKIANCKHRDIFAKCTLVIEDALDPQKPLKSLRALKITHKKLLLKNNR